MNFSNNLKRLRKENNLSQEGLAEILDISRQAVSKYEQGNSYPEIDKLKILSKEFEVSIDSLLSEEKDVDIKPFEKDHEVLIPSREGKISVRDYTNKTIATYSEFRICPMVMPKENQPKCTLIGIVSRSFWGETIKLLGYYASQEDATKEIKGVQQAIKKGESTYNLIYCANVNVTWSSITLVE